jgi:hypothetical protein
VKNLLAEKLYHYVQRRRSSDCDSLRCAQEEILCGMLGVSSVVLVFPYVLGVVLAARAGLRTVVVVDTLVFFLLRYLVFKPGLSYHARVYGLLGLIEFLALARKLRLHSPSHAAILDDSTIDLLSRSAPLHDIGEIGVPDEILLKPGKLTAEEFEEMKKHAIYGKDALNAVTDDFVLISKTFADQ